MKDEDNIPEPKNLTIKHWNPSAQPSESKNSPVTNEYSAKKASVRKELKAKMSRDVRRQQQKNEQEHRQKQMRKRGERAALKRLSTPEQRRKFLAARRSETKAAAQAAKAQALQRKREVAALSPDEKKALYREQRYQRKIRRRASRAYIPLEILKYTALAALAAGIIYLGNVSYGVFVDNSYAFQNTGHAVAHPSDFHPSDTETSAEVDPYSSLLSGADLDFMKNRVNILVMGIDKNEERENWGSFRTDTMILVSINFETNNACIISLPRDSYVWIYNKGYHNRINTAFGAGGGLDGDGLAYAMNTVSMALGGIPVNNYVCFDMEVVMDVVNAMGGIDYDVEVPFDLEGRTMKAGFQHLDGQGVLDYCRVRHITGGSDIARTKRQRKMITAVFQWMKEHGQLQDIPAIYSAVASNINTDLTFEQITSLAAFAMKMDSSCLHEYLLPGGYLDMEGASFWGIDQSEKQQMIYEIFGQNIQVDNDDDISSLRHLVDLKNEAVAAGQSALSEAAGYISANSAYVTAELRAQYDGLRKALVDALAKKNPQNIGKTIQPITDATHALRTWFKNTLKPAVAAAMASATPPPGPSDSVEPSGTPGPSDSAGPTGTPAPETTLAPPSSTPAS